MDLPLNVVLLGFWLAMLFAPCIRADCFCAENYAIFSAFRDSTKVVTFTAGSEEPGFEAIFSQYEKFDGNTDSNNGVVIALPPMWVTSFSARIINFEGYQDWRWELYGCHSHLSDGDAMLIIMKSMRSALWKMPPLLNALDLDQETANSTFFLSDDDINTCLDAPDPLSAWHSLVRIPLLPGDNPMRIIGEAIQCDFRHVLVTHQQNNASVSCGHSTRVCRLLDNGHCEAQCGDNDVDLRDVAVYVRGTPDMRLCEISSDGL
ncbi:hypothetical protein CAPTEDRAFT_203491 [Capitella teleta]|uniref:Uncharacterized protein n=1 Tax=Capitella teleta TaxID=283909 RepID=R7V6Q9_CAPTE|nr:hypothetical protein CAPTEDRAFT_203491 [Capitella teleta]|eukprot:ELU14137.1 hypothetical protein CAPTEDRAFT_203491 [Capitella teleta]